MAWRQPSNLREWLWILSCHKKKFFFSSVAVMIAVVVASQWIPREYRAKAIFERTNDAALEQMGSDTVKRNLQLIRQGIQQDLKGRASIEQLIEDLHLLRDLPHTPDGELTIEAQLAKNDLVRDITGRIGIGFITKTAQQDQIVVSYTDPDRELVPKVVNQLVENYIRNTRQQLDSMLLNAKTFFEREVARYRARISELESRKLRFEMDHAGLRPNRPASVEERLEKKRSRLAAVTMELNVAQEKRTKLAEWVDSQPDFIERSQTSQNPELGVIRKKIASLENEIEKHLYQMQRTEAHPAVVKARLRLTELKQTAKAIKEEVVVSKNLVPNTDRMAAEREIESLAGTVVALERGVAKLIKEVEHFEVLNRNFFVIRNEFLQIQRELRESRRQLSFWDRNLRRTITALTAEIGQRGVRMRMRERAPDLARPSTPTLPGILMTAVVLGLGTGTLLMILSELLDHSFRNVEQAVDELKLPVMGAINEIVPPSERFRRRVFGWGLYPVIGVAMVIMLLSSVTLAYLSLNEPRRYEELISDPGHFISQTIFGQA